MAYGDDFFKGTILEGKSNTLGSEEKKSEKTGQYGDDFFAGTILDKNKEPDSIINAKLLMDKPDEDYRGLCQRFAEFAAYGKKDLSPSAIQFWKDAPNKVQGFKGMKKGDLIYFDANKSNRGFGHVGVYEGNGRFISATDNGIESQPIESWVNKTSQRPLGYLPV